MKLKHRDIRDAKPGPKPYKLTDGHGMYLYVSTAGGKIWRYDYRFEGKKKTMVLGKYPVVLLMDARKRHLVARELLEVGVDPMARRADAKVAKTVAQSMTFESIAREWFDVWHKDKAANYAPKTMSLLERDIFPGIGHLSLPEVRVTEILSVAHSIIARGSIETAHRAINTCGQVFQFAILTDRAQTNPTLNLSKALPKPVHKNFTATLDEKRLGEILRAFDHYHGGHAVRAALRLMPLVFVRPGELRNAKWDEIDLEAATWSYFVTKIKKDHIVPLATQAVSILRELYPYTGQGMYVFPSPRRTDKAMSDNGVLVAMRELGITKEEMTGHGFRAVARTKLDEVLNWRPDLIEAQLSHAVKDANGRAYNRTTHLDKRTVMMQEWADYLDKLKLKK